MKTITKTTETPTPSGKTYVLKASLTYGSTTGTHGEDGISYEYETAPNIETWVEFGGRRLDTPHRVDAAKAKRLGLPSWAAGVAGGRDIGLLPLTAEAVAAVQ